MQPTQLLRWLWPLLWRLLEEGKGREVLVDLAAVVNVDADYFGIAAHHLC